MSESSPFVIILILNWNNPADTIACLEAVRQLDYPNFDILVVDNGSTDDSVAQIHATHPPVEILETGQNLGYTGGNNLGIRHALRRGADFIWLLNDDTLVSPTSLARLIQTILVDPSIAAVAPWIYTREMPNQVLTCGGQLDCNGQSQWLPVLPTPDDVMDVDYVSGCALLLRSSAVQQIGDLCENFFAYHEDVEWCWRAKKAGWRVVSQQGAQAWHPDTRLRDNTSPQVCYYITRNELMFLRQYQFPYLQRFFGHLRTLASWSINPRWRHKHAQRNALFRALVDFSRGKADKK